MNIPCNKNGCNNNGRYENGEYLYGVFSENHGFICMPCFKELREHLKAVYISDGIVTESDIVYFLEKGKNGYTIREVEHLLSQFK